MQTIWFFLLLWSSQPIRVRVALFPRIVLRSDTNESVGYFTIRLKASCKKCIEILNVKNSLHVVKSLCTR